MNHRPPSAHGGNQAIPSFGHEEMVKSYACSIPSLPSLPCSLPLSLPLLKIGENACKLLLLLLLQDKHKLRLTFAKTPAKRGSVSVR